MCRSPLKSRKTRPQSEALCRSIRCNRKVRDKMHSLRNSAWGKHFIGGNGDLDYGFIRQEVGILVLRERRVFVLILRGRGDIPPMNSVDQTNRYWRSFRNNDRQRRNRRFGNMKPG